MPTTCPDCSQRTYLDPLPADEPTRFFDQAAASRYLWTVCGVKIAPSTLKKLRCAGNGPPFFRGFGRRVHYELESLKKWGDAQRSLELRSTSEYSVRT